MSARITPALRALVGVVFLSLAGVVLHRELAAYHYGDVIRHLGAIPDHAVAFAVALAALGYLSLTGYDALAFRWIHSPLRYPRIALASFIAFVFSHNLGVFGGTAVRYRMFTSWGVPPGDLARALAFNMLTFWLGFLALGGVALMLQPLPVPGAAHALVATSRPVGVLFLAVLAAYVVSTLRPGRALRVRGFQIAQPGPSYTAAQLALSSVDWALSAGVFYALLPEGRPGYPIVLGAVMLAQVIGLASHVPGGLGVFDTVIVLLLAPWLPGDQVLGSALAYRIVYYFLPLIAGVVLFLGYEVGQRRRAIMVARAVLARWVPELVPRLLAVIVFAGGVVLMLSGATPAAPGRVERLEQLLPLSMLEASHLLASMLGVGLLLVARGIQRRLDGAYWVSLALLGAGAVVSLGKGLDWEEAVLLSAMAVALVPYHRWFYRPSSLFSESFSPAWITSIAVIFATTGFVVMLAYRHVEYGRELWWQFAFDANAPRSLRALAGAGLVLACFALARLLRPAPPVSALPTPGEIDRAAALASASVRSNAFLALVGDKHLVFHERGHGFLMYGIHGRGWVAMGDPVARSPEVRSELAWRFREQADRHRGLTTFYDVGGDDIPLYLELGLQLRKLGEEARVPLADFSLAGRRRAQLRQAVNRMEREGVRFELVPTEGVPRLLDAMQRLSDDWLAHKRTREKRFSLGRFDRDYLARLPVAVVHKDGRLVAFANVWAGEARDEMSIDLMRHSSDMPKGAMEYLFAQLMLWGRAEGYQWFSLGMAPLSGVEHHPLAPLWDKLGALLFRHGEHFYNFRGLRAFKDKFCPVWEPRYVATQGGVATAFALAHVAALVSGGVAGVVAK